MNKFLLLSIICAIGISTQAQTIIQNNGKYGLTDPFGNIVIEPKLDSIYLKRTESHLGTLGHKHYYLLNNTTNKIGLAFFALDSGMIILDIEFDEIIAEAPELTTLRKGNKYGYITYSSETNGSAMFSSLSGVKYVTNVYISDIIYDFVGINYPLGSYMIKDGKYGKLNSFGAFIPPIYDTIPESINRYQYYENRELVITNIYSVIKNDKYGIVQIRKNMVTCNAEVEEIIPPIYNKNELLQIYLNDFLINQKDKPIRIYNTKDSTYTTLHTADGKPILSHGADVSKYYVDSYDYKVFSKSSNAYDSIITASVIYAYKVGNEYIVEKKI